MDRFQLRRDTAARWAEVNPILLEGEVGFETDTKRRKIGDGVHRWNVLEYLAAENIVQETGDSDKVVMSQKAVTEKLSELGSKVENIINEKLDVLYVTDANGNVIAKFDGDGIHTTSMEVLKNGTLVNLLALLADKVDKVVGKQLSTEDFTSILKAKLENIKNIDNIWEDEDGLYIADVDGNVAFKITANGDVKYNGSDFTKYQLFTIGDSLSASNVWNVKCAESLGCEFNKEGNIKAGYNLSTGGTNTLGVSLSSAFYRVLNLEKQGVIKNDGENAIIVFENINDFSLELSGTINDKPILPIEPIETGKTFAEFTSDYLATIPMSQRKVGARALVNSDVNGKMLTISKLPNVEGDIKIHTGYSGVGVQTYTIHIIPQSSDVETMAYALDKIIEVYYTGLSRPVERNGNSVVFAPDTLGKVLTLQYEDVSTGMVCSISDVADAPINFISYFTGDSIDDWTDRSMWNHTDFMNMAKAWKGMIEWVMATFTKAHIFIAGFPYHSVKPSEYLLPNGSFDHIGYYNDGEKQARSREYYKFWQEICKLYSISYIDVANNCGINLSNFNTYYYDNNVHPKDVGYMRFGECVAAQISNYITKK